MGGFLYNFGRLAFKSSCILTMKSKELLNKLDLSRDCLNIGTILLNTPNLLILETNTNFFSYSG